MIYDVIIVGGGAAGFFCAIQCAERNPNLKILILEKSNKLLSKVKISGGGRCNVTHACFDPREMVNHYPRGNKELLGPFHQFLCGDMMGWLDDNGVATKIEADGRVFPESNQSQTIIDCFMDLCTQRMIKIYTSCSVQKLELLAASEEEQKEVVSGVWQVHTKNQMFKTKAVLMAAGSSNAVWKMMAKLGHQIIAPVPSLFTFNIKHPLLKDLQGLSMPNAEVRILTTKFKDSGPLLITHWGLSGPAILKLSAWAARTLHDKKYQFKIAINWLGNTFETTRVKERIEEVKKMEAKKKVVNLPLFKLPKRLWQRMVQLAKIENKNYGDISNAEIKTLVSLIGNCELIVNGKSTFKDEFVTCGGIDTKEINFKTMESKLFPQLFFAGEVINIDAITGGFNFQAAWTTAFIAAKAINQAD